MFYEGSNRLRGSCTSKSLSTRLRLVLSYELEMRLDLESNPNRSELCSPDGYLAERVCKLSI